VLQVVVEAAFGGVEATRLLHAGHCTADLLNSMLGLAVLIACGLVVGWQWREGGGAALLAVGLLLLLRFALLWVGIYLGLLFKNPEAVVAVQILV
jgi:ABC-2 type transport system permease protein